MSTFLPDGLVTLRGAVLTIVKAHGVEKRVLDSEEAYGQVLSEMFGLELPEVAALYAKVWQRHLDWLAAGDGILRK